MQTFSFTLDTIRAIIGDTTVEGAQALNITGIASLETAGPSDLSFLGNRKYKKKVAQSEAAGILVPKDFSGAPKAGQAFLRVPDPSMALTLLCEAIEKQLAQRPKPGIDPSAIVDPTAEIAEDVYVGPFCVIEAGTHIASGSELQAQVVIGRHVRIGRDCRLAPQVVIGTDCVLGNRVQLHLGVVIGADGFGYTTVKGKHRKIPQIGNVVIEDEVEIGANSTVDRGRFHETRIGRGTKIDNLVQIAHNVTIGPHSIIVAQVGIAGSTILEEGVMIGGQAGIAGHITLGKYTQIAAQSGIDHDLAPGAKIRGRPGNPIALENRIIVLQKRLPDLFKRVARLEEHIDSDASG